MLVDSVRLRHPQDIGPRYSGVLLGMSNTAGVLAGVLGTAATGYILKNGTWDEAGPPAPLRLPVFCSAAFIRRYLQFGVLRSVRCNSVRQGVRAQGFFKSKPPC